MRKSLSIVCLSFLLLSCGSIKRTMFGTTEKTLLKTVSIEQGCEKENIEIINSIKGLHGATYSLNVCGQKMVYKEVGTVFMEASKADKTVENLQNH